MQVKYSNSSENALLPVEVVELKPLETLGRKLRLGFVGILKRIDRHFFPFAHFKDCGSGSYKAKLAAFEWNKEHKNIIIPYIGAWGMRGSAFGVALLTAERIQVLGIDTSLFQAFLALIVTFSLVSITVMWVGWLGLTHFRTE